MMSQGWMRPSLRHIIKTMFDASRACFRLRVIGILVKSRYSSRVTETQSLLVWIFAMVFDLLSSTSWWFVDVVVWLLIDGSAFFECWLLSAVNLCIVLCSLRLRKRLWPELHDPDIELPYLSSLWYSAISSASRSFCSFVKFCYYPLRFEKWLFDRWVIWSVTITRRFSSSKTAEFLLSELWLSELESCLTISSLLPGLFDCMLGDFSLGINDDWRTVFPLDSSSNI